MKKPSQTEASRRAAGRYLLAIRLTAAETAWARACASAAGMSVTGWARRVLRGEFAAKPIPKEESSK